MMIDDASWWCWWCRFRIFQWISTILSDTSCRASPSHLRRCQWWIQGRKDVSLGRKKVPMVGRWPCVTPRGFSWSPWYLLMAFVIKDHLFHICSFDTLCLYIILVHWSILTTVIRWSNLTNSSLMTSWWWGPWWNYSKGDNGGECGGSVAIDMIGQKPTGPVLRHGIETVTKLVVSSLNHPIILLDG